MKNIKLHFKTSVILFFVAFLFTYPAGLYAQCSSTVSTFPYSEGFESGFGLWTQSSSDNLNWTRDAYGTSSFFTGPSSAYEGTWYVYVEASGNGIGYPNKTAILNGPCFNLSGKSSATFSFRYHMYGATMGSLYLQVRVNGSSTWTTVWSRSGNQGNSWQLANVDLNAYLGSTIQLRFRGVTGSSFESDMTIDDLNFTASGGPSNDICSGAIDVNCGDVVTGSTSSASGDGSLPFCGTTATSAGGVWYHFTGTGQDIEVTTCNAGSNYDTKLFVFTGSCGSLTCVTGNDDSSCGFSGLRSTVNFSSVSGTDYYIYVTGFSSATGNFEMSISCTTPGDVCSDALDISCGDVVTGNTSIATGDGSLPFCGTGSTSAGGIWYHFTGTGDDIEVTTCNAGSNYDTKLFVFTGSCGSLTCLTGNDDSSCGFSGLRSTVNFSSVSGTDYYIYVTGFSSATGIYEMSLTCTSACSPPDANCQSATVLLNAGGVGTLSVNQVNDNSTYDCGLQSMTLSKTSFNCSDLGNNTVTLTVTDINGDSDNCTATVTVVDNIAPQVSCPTLPAVAGCSAIVPDLTIEPGEVITNSSADFSGAQGNNNWEYGSYAAFNTNGFAQLPNFTGFVWNNPGVGAILDFPQLDANGGHPQFEGLTWAVRRWTSPFTGTIQISGDFYDRDGNCGDGANVRIFHNGSQIYEYLNIPLGTTGYSFNLNVNAGDQIDFAIDPKFDASCDDTHFTANITAQTGTTYNDNCGVVNITQSPAPGTVVGPGNTTITLTAFDAAGLSNSCTTTLTVQDTEAPTANCQNVTVNIGAGGTVSVTPAQMNNNSTDNCGIDPNGFSLAGTTMYDCDDVGSTFNVTLTVTDNAGLTSTCSASVTVGDANGNCNAAPTAVCQNVTVNADAGCQGTATANDFDGGSFDSDGDPFSITISPVGPYQLGATNVTLTVQDVNGATDNCTATITVVDVTIPNITCPFDITVNADPGICGAVINYDQPSATDNCGTGNLPTSLPGFTYMGTFQGHTYFLSNSTTTPEDAHAQAIASGGHLVTINSAAENTYVSNFNSGRIWIGHTDRDSEGNWEWVTGEPVIYTNWAPGEPNNYGGNEDWAVINWSGTNPDWNDWLPYATALFAIEFDGGTIPTMLASGLGIGATFPVGTTTETWTATDDAGNMDQCSFTVTVNDNVPPTAICQQLWYALTPNGTVTIPASAADNGSNDACGIASMTLSPNSFDCSDVGPNSATLTVTDNNGLSASCSLTITIQDITFPNAICQNATVQLDANGTGTLAVSDINNGSNDACGIASLSVAPNTFGCGNVGANTVTLTVTDNNGHSSSCTSSVNVQDNTPPAISCPSNISTTATSASGAVVNYATPVGTDNCTPTTNQTGGLASGATFPVGSTTNTFVVTDQGGLSASCSFMVTVTGVAPDINCPANITVNNDAGTCEAVVNFSATETTGVPPSNISYSDLPGSAFPVGATTVTATATNAVGTDQCTFTITVNDNEDPSFGEDPTAVTLYDNDFNTPNIAVIDYPGGYEDLSSQSVNDLFGPGWQQIYTVETILINGPVNRYTDPTGQGGDYAIGMLTSAQNDKVSLTFDVQGKDYLNVKFDLSAIDLFVNGNQQFGVATPIMRVSLYDSPAGNFNISSPGTLLDQKDLTGTAPGSHPSIFNWVTVVAGMDASGSTDGNVSIVFDLIQSGYASFDNLIIQASDEPAEEDVCPDDMIVNSDPGNCGAVVTYAPVIATDNCSPVTTTQTAGLGSGGTFPVGTTTETYLATDPSGNTATCTFTITVEDNEDPTITCPGDISVNATSPAGAVVNYTTPSASDNCFGLTVALTAGLADGATFPIGTTVVTYTATDGSMNTASCSFNVTVTGIAPDIKCPADITVNTDSGQCNAVVSFSATETTGIPASMISYSHAPGSTFPLGTTVVTATATNTVGSDMCTFSVIVEDNEAPNAICQPTTVQLDANGNGSITAADVDGGSNDACGIAGLSVQPSSFNCSNVGANTVTLTVTDNNNQVSTCTANVTVVDNIPPDADCQDITVQLNAGGTATIVPTDIDNGSSDACGIASFALDINSFDCDDVGEAGVSNDYALDFDGTNDHLNAGNAPSLKITGTQITLEAWIKASGFQAIHLGDIINKQQLSGQAGYFFRIGGGGDIQFYLGTPVGWKYVQANGVLTLNTWHHIACVYNGSDMRIFVDGVQKAILTGVTETIDDTNNNLCIGCQLDASHFFDGQIDETRVWNIARTPAEIATYYNQTLTGNEPGLVLYYAMEDGPGSSMVSDLSSAGNDAVLTNMDPNSDWVPGVPGVNVGGGPGNNTVTLTVTDVNGNVSTCTANVTVEDNVAPNAICQPTTVQLDAFGNGSITASDVDGGSNDACGIASLSVSPSSFNCSNVGANTVTLTVTDNNDQVSTCTATVTVEDNVAPTAVCQDITVYLDNTGNASIVATDVDGGSMDACGLASLSVAPSTFDCSNVGMNAVTLTLTAVDNNGNPSTCLAMVMVVDNVAPNAVCQNTTVQLDANGNGSITASDVDGGSNDACGIASLGVSQSTFGCANVGANTVMLTVTDNNNQVSTCTATVTVQDNVAPNAVCQNTTVQLDANGNGSITATDVNGGSNDACGIASLSAAPNSFGCGDVGANTVTLTVTDNNNQVSTCTASVTVVDNVAPNAVCQNTTVQLDANGNGSITASDVDGGSNDACGIAGLSVAPNSFGCGDVGANTVTLTVTDNNNQVSSCTASVTVVDNVAPTAICQNTTVQLDANGNGSITTADVDGGSNDACGIASLSVQPSAFGCANVGANTVTLTVTDNNNLVSTCTATVTVQDNVAPMAVCQNTTVQLDANGNGSITTADVDGGSSDACGVASLSVQPSAFGCANVGANTVTLTVTDNNNQVSTCTATVAVQDNVAPTAVCKNATVELDANGNGSITAGDVDGGSNDACGIASLTVSPSTFTCDEVGGNSVTLTVTDNNNQVSTCTATVTVVDKVAPNAICQNAIVQLDASGNGSITVADVDGGSNDACGIASLSVMPSTFSCGNIGGNTVTLTVTDNNNQVSTCTATVTVQDNVAPIAICQNTTVQLDDNGSGSITAADIDNGSNDACGIASMSVSPSSFDCSNLGENTVTLTVTDNNNNPATCTATVTVEDNIDPVITCPADITMGTDAGLCGASVEFLVTATDNCDETTITCTIGGSGPTGDCAWNEVDLTIVFDNYPEETSWTIQDMNDNIVASGGPYVNQPDGSILDLTFNLPDGEYLFIINDSEGDGMCCDYGFGSYTLSSYGNLIVSGGIFGYSDKTNFCVETPPPGGNELLTVVESGDFFPVGTHLVTCTVFDGSENSDVCTFVITVNDTEAPMIDTPCPENITLCGAQNVFWTPPTATDNCAVVSTVSNYDPGDYFGVGTYTVTYTFFDEAGLSVSCSFMITINPVPDVVISQEDVPLWCQGIQVLTANVLNPDDLTYPLTFEWSDGLPGDPVVIAPANGEYTVTVTDALNCSTIVSTVVDEDISSLFSAYTIISGEEFEMYSSDVLGGGVGIEDADEGEIGLNSNIYTFFKANLANVMIDGSSYVNELIDADFDLPFPPFQGNSFNDLNDIVVPANTTVTLSGTNYGWVTLETGATLIIDNATMYFQNLATKKDATIIFNQPSDLMIKRRMTIGETNTINPDEHTCVIYVQDKASINQGSVVTANIYSPEGLDVNDSGVTLTTYMTGIFISNDRIGSDHNVVWNWNLNCSYLPSASGALPLAQSEGNDAVGDIEDGTIDKSAMGLNVYPNPASGIVNITVADLLGQEVELYMYDAFGKQVMRKPLGKLEVGTVSIDLSSDRYASGMYHVSLKAGEEWYNVRFILSK